MTYANSLYQALVILPPEEGNIRILGSTTASAVQDVREFGSDEIEIVAEGADHYVLFGRHSLISVNGAATTGVTRCYRIPQDQALRCKLMKGVQNFMAYAAASSASGTLLRLTKSSQQEPRVGSSDWTPAKIDTLSSFTGWWRSDTYTLTSSKVSQLSDLRTGGTNHLTQGTAGARPTVNTNPSFLSYGPSITFDGSAQYMTGPAFSSLIAASAGTIFAVARPTVTTDDASAFNNGCVVSGSSAKLALGYRSSGAVIAGNNDGSAESIQIATAVTNTPQATLAGQTAAAVPVMISSVWRHSGGNLYVRSGYDAGAASEASVSSGNTASLAGNIQLGLTGSTYLAMDWLETLTFNVSVPEDLMELIFDYFGRRYGVPNKGV